MRSTLDKTRLESNYPMSTERSQPWTPNQSPHGQTAHTPQQRTLPPASFLELHGISSEQPEEVFCPQCSQDNANYHYFLYLRYGTIAFYYHPKGKDQFSGESRGNWMTIRSVRCQKGHVTFIDGDGKAVMK